MLSISNTEFEGIYKVMFDRTGVRLKDTKKPLVISRLRKRLEELNLTSFGQYLKILTPNNTEELEYFVNALTTNETFFFRHAVQFNYLFETVLPKIVVPGKRVEVWSAASSSGEEPYSLAMMLMEYSKKVPCDFKVHASDINSEVIAEAKMARYDERAVKEMPDSLRQRYLRVVPALKGHGTEYAVTDEIKRRVQFFEHNLQRPSTMKNMDIIFLRNVLIYFEKDIKEKVVNLLEPCLKPGGYFFISLSENLNDIRTGLKLIGSGVFIKP